MNRRRLADESGFTLVELIMAIAIMGLVIAPFAGVLFVSLRTTDETSSRLSGSNDAQLLATWLPPDVHSTGNQPGDVVAWPDSNTECSGATNLLRLRWRESVGAGTNVYVAAYAIGPGVDNTWRLTRYLCVNGGAPTPHVVARYLYASWAGLAVTVSDTQVTMVLLAAKSPHEGFPYWYSVSAHRRTP